MATYHSGEIDETQSLAYVEADNNEVRLEQAPRLGARCVMEFEAVLALPGAYLKDVGLVHVLEEMDGNTAREVLAPLADSAAGC